MNETQAYPPPVVSARVSRTIDYMRRNLDQPLTIENLAARGRCSVFHLIREFRRDTGKTPHALLVELRVRRAADLLISGHSISDVAYETGFCDQTHFSRHFKRVHGQTPGRFQRSAREPALAFG